MSIYQMPRPEERHSVPDLIRQLFLELGELIQQHIQLAKTEVREEAVLISKAVALGVVTLMLVQVTLIFVGHLLINLFQLTELGVIGSTVITILLFLGLTAVGGYLCFKQVKTAQNILKQRDPNET